MRVFDEPRLRQGTLENDITPPRRLCAPWPSTYYQGRHWTPYEEPAGCDCAPASSGHGRGSWSQSRREFLSTGANPATHRPLSTPSAPERRGLRLGDPSKAFATS